MSPIARIADFMAFQYAALRKPGQVGAIAPSGPVLGRLMARGLGAAGGPVLEIGPGTGSLTRALLRAGVAEEQLILVELDQGLAATLSRRFPRARVINDAAQNLPRHGLPEIGGAISGLPMLLFPEALQEDILRGVFSTLAPGVPLVQFTYGRRPPIAPAVCRRLGLTPRLRGRVLANLPPARVYEFHRDPG